MFTNINQSMNAIKRGEWNVSTSLYINTDEVYQHTVGVAAQGRKKRFCFKTCVRISNFCPDVLIHGPISKLYSSHVKRFQCARQLLLTFVRRTVCQTVGCYFHTLRATD